MLPSVIARRRPDLPLYRNRQRSQLVARSWKPSVFHGDLRHMSDVAAKGPMTSDAASPASRQRVTQPDLVRRESRRTLWNFLLCEPLPVRSFLVFIQQSQTELVRSMPAACGQFINKAFHRKRVELRGYRAPPRPRDYRRSGSIVHAKHSDRNREEHRRHHLRGVSRIFQTFGESKIWRMEVETTRCGPSYDSFLAGRDRLRADDRNIPVNRAECRLHGSTQLDWFPNLARPCQASAA